MSVPGYRWYGGTGGEFFGRGSIGTELIIGGVDSGGNPTGGEGTVWDALTGGSQVTDLFDEADAATDVVDGDTFGNYRVQAPDTYGTLYVDTGGSKRYPMHPMDLADVVLAQAATITSLTTDVATAIADAAAASAAAAAAPTLSDVDDRIGVLLDALRAEPNPFPQYLILKGTLLNTGAGFWGETTFPTTAQGATDGDYLAYEG